MTARDVDRLVSDASIIRNRAKIQATVDNARAMMSASPRLAALAKSYEITRRRTRPKERLPPRTSDPYADARSEQRARGKHPSTPEVRPRAPAPHTLLARWTMES
jgi:DNA-3-methyladenine glycosylase I